MISPRLSTERGHFNHGWLDTFHTFSFGDYIDPRHMGYRSLRVINEDVIQPGRGFPMHAHHDMEILTYIISGSLAHRDDMGNGSSIEAGQMQRMSAGRGVRHSEFNPSESDPAHLLQIWIRPKALGASPSYETRSFDSEGTKLVASRDGRAGSLTLLQDVEIHKIDVAAGGRAAYDLQPERHAWLQVVSGDVTVDGQTRLSAGDGAAVERQAFIELRSDQGVEVLLFDLA